MLCVKDIKMLIDKLVSLIKDNKLGVIFLLASSLSVSLFSLDQKNLLFQLISKLDETLKTKTILALMPLLIGLSISLVYLYIKLKNKIKIEEFKFVDPPGYCTHPKKTFKICPKCLYDKERPSISPLVKTNDYWICSVCDNPVGIKGEAFTIED